MFEKVIKHDVLGNRVQILYVLELLEKENSLVEDLNKACISATYSFSNSFKGVVCLLEWLDIIRINKFVRLHNNVERKNFDEQFCTLLFAKMAEENELHNFINNHNIIFDNFDDSIVVKNNLINLKFSSLRNLLINFDLFLKDDVSSTQFVINKNHSSWFVDEIIPLIETSRNKNRSLRNFIKQQEVKNKLGEDAEKNVLNYERAQREKHPKCTNIKIISAMDVGAGYDIQSYKSDNSILLDKFIEVKSYSGEVSFYWSRNELEVAKREQNNYFIYLVNRDEMNNHNYEPIMIENPYQKFMNNGKWKKGCENWNIKIKE